MTETINKKSNKLINEKSPYLLQHAYNPVNWYSWCDEAFEKAKSENKPIFLSIGYSTCHWCHVMEKESFEDDEVAELMNKYFVSIKVDREERPDIDGIYMTVCQIMTGSGGWPLTVFLTPDKKPFFSGTYFSKDSRYGRIGMMDLLPRINEAWHSKNKDVNESADHLIKVLNQISEFPEGNALSENIFEEAFSFLKNRFDSEAGGFGSAPKFPTAHNLLFLLRYWKYKNDKQSLSMVEQTLQEMSMGGIYDHVGFGFHRYSTDSNWLVPHFEKMLYDQAMLAMAYTEAFQATGNGLYKKTAEEVFEYVLRDMTSSDGGFYSAEDADSEGEEGKFYVWSCDEISSILTKEELELSIKVFNLKQEGNHLEESTREKTGKNILHLKNISVINDKSNEKIEEIRQKLFNVRRKRIRPLKDDKILTSWNGLMITALAKAAGAFENENYACAAEKAVDFIFKRLKTNDGLLHSFRNDKAEIIGNLDDYACMIWGLLELYEIKFNIKHLKLAIDLSEYIFKHFWDEKTGGFYFTADTQEKLIVRQKEIYDGALPSGNSITLMNLLRLSKITAEKKYADYALKFEKAVSENIKQSPASHMWMLSSVAFARWKPYEVIVVGDFNTPETGNILKLIRSTYLPHKVLLFKSSNNSSGDINLISKFVQEYKCVDGKTTVYICENFACKSPITEIEKLRDLLKT